MEKESSSEGEKGEDEEDEDEEEREESDERRKRRAKTAKGLRQKSKARSEVSKTPFFAQLKTKLTSINAFRNELFSSHDRA